MLESYHSHFSARPKLRDGESVARVYHYTSVSGAMGIVGDRQLWASNVHYMNDYTEYKHGIDIVQHELAHLAQLSAWQDKRELLTTAREYMGRMIIRHIFASSFSEKHDALSQWRGYAGGGISIGFLFDDLVDVGSRQNFHLVKCVYSREEKSNIARAFIQLGCRTEIAEELAACRTYGHWATCARIAITIRIRSRMALYEQLPPN
jgi:hypothetical protein